MVEYFTDDESKAKLIVELGRNTSFFTVYTDADQCADQLASENGASFKTERKLHFVKMVSTSTIAGVFLIR
jgi:hypothetical protein